MARTKDETIKEITYEYLEKIDSANPPSPENIQGDILDEVRNAFKLENAVRDNGDKWKIPDKLSPSQITSIMLKIYDIRCIACAGDNADTSYDLLAIYQTDGYNKGIYVTDEKTFHTVARKYNYSLTINDIKEIMAQLKDYAVRVKRCNDRDLIAVNNGIFNYNTKKLEPFSPDRVFIAKSHVNYNPNAKNIVIHNKSDGTDWDIESWMKSLSDDDEVVNLLWEIIGAIIRPHVRWNKSAWLYSTKGNNGKGTLCELMRNICGDGTYASIPIADFAKDFMLEPLTRASAIIVDENDVGSFIDKAANLKAVITNDVIALNRKFKSPIAYQFFGFMIQCLNEMPRIKDKSDSFYRRQIFIPFTKCFTGHERKYIKNDYLHRSEVLEYALYKVLNMNYYTLSEPETCKNTLEMYKEFNDPVRQFIDEILPECVWDLLPFTFLYDLYKAWFDRNSPSGSKQGKNTFINDLINALGPDSEWESLNTQTKIWVGHKMDEPEYLILEYNLKTWENPNYKGTDKSKICKVLPKSHERGLVRKQPKSKS